MAIKNPNSERAIRLKVGLLHLADAIYAAFGNPPKTQGVESQDSWGTALKNQTGGDT